MKKIKISNIIEKPEQIKLQKEQLINQTFDKKYIKKTNFIKKFIISIKLLIDILSIIIFFLIFKLYIQIKKKSIIIEGYYEKFKREGIEWPLPKEIKFKPVMTLKELKAFCYFMKPGNIYFEFGAGGSTNVASYYKMKIYSVESDTKWHKLLKDNNIKANYITVDLKARSLGHPGKETNIEDWKKYIQAYKKEYNADIILIDGRFRVACGLDIFNKIRNDTVVLIHDYTNRKEYHILENYYVKIETWDTLVSFVKRPNISLIPEIIYNKYLKDPTL